MNYLALKMVLIFLDLKSLENWAICLDLYSLEDGAICLYLLSLEDGANMFDSIEP